MALYLGLILQNELISDLTKQILTLSGFLIPKLETTVREHVNSEESYYESSLEEDDEEQFSEQEKSSDQYSENSDDSEDSDVS